MEIEVHGKALSITPSCSKVMKTGKGTPCSYDQWVNYAQGIQNLKDFKKITGQPYKKGVYPDLQKTQELTSKADQTGLLDKFRVIENFDPKGAPDPYAVFLQKGAETFKYLSNKPDCPDALRTNGMGALRSILIQRVSGSAEKFKSEQAKARRIVTLNEEFFDPKHEEWGKIKVIDHAAYLADNPQITAEEYDRIQQKFYDANHENNIEKLQAEWNEILERRC